MTKKKIIAVLVCLAFLCTMVLPASALFAQIGADSSQNNLPKITAQAQNDDYLHFSKGVVSEEPGKDGNYTIRLEAYAKGGVMPIIDTYKSADIVLVIDQSSSMRYLMDGFENKDEHKHVQYGLSRTTALREALNAFRGELNKQFKNDPGLSHRIAVVGYAGAGDTATGLFYPTDNDIAFSTYEDGNLPYKSAFQTISANSGMDYLDNIINGNASKEIFNQAVQPDCNKDCKKADCTCVCHSIGTDQKYLRDNGDGTRHDVGLKMAEQIFANNKIENTQGENNQEKTPKVVILFTDGTPGIYQHGGTTTDGVAYDSDGVENKETVVNQAVYQANILKNTYGATVYTVGFFSGANPNAKPSNSNKTSDMGNTLMQCVSSNYPAAKGTMGDTKEIKVEPGNRVDNEEAGYYLIPNNSDVLKEIFTQLAQTIGGDTQTTTLDGNAVMTDIISPYFDLAYTGNDPAAAVKVKTYDYDGLNSSGQYKWKNGTTVTQGITVTSRPDEDNPTIKVDGFDYSANWVGEKDGQNRGKKLVVEIKVKPREGFLGGNGVPTNLDGAISQPQPEDQANISSGDALYASQPSPTVNVPVVAPAINAPDYNVYLNDTLTVDTLRAGAKVGEQSVSDWWNGLAWQNDYVTLTGVTVSQGSQSLTTDLAKLTQDTTYKAKLTISAKKGTGAASTETANRAVNVFKPEVTFADQEVWYGNNADSLFTQNPTAEWKHGTTLDTAVTMTGTAPALRFAHTPEAGKIAETADGQKYINTKDDFGVAVDVMLSAATENPDAAAVETKINEYTTFLHDACDKTDCGYADTKGFQYLCHVNTCTLTIQKTVVNPNNANTDLLKDDEFIFSVAKDGSPYTGAVIRGLDVFNGEGSVTITGLPVGNYTVTEDGRWSWRYTATGSGAAILNSQHPTATVTITNTYTNDKWLGDTSDAVKNVYHSDTNSTDVK